MSNNVVEWIVEEVDSKTGARTVRPFPSYSEALEVYNDLKEKNNNFLSIQKSEKKLLLE